MTSISKGKRYLQTIGALLFWLAVWHLAAGVIGQDLFLVPPAKVVRILIDQIQQTYFWGIVLYSFVRIASGFLLAIIVGVLLAVISATSTLVRVLLEPFFTVIKSIPVASFIILVLIWIGSRNLSVAIGFLMVLPLVYTNVLQGIMGADKKLLEMAKIFHMSFGKKLKAIYIPGTYPYFTAACKLSIGLCWKSGIAAEVIGLPVGSIGEQLYQSKIFLDTGELFSWTIVIIIISYTFEKLFFKLLSLAERKVGIDGSSLKAREELQ